MFPTFWKHLLLSYFVVEYFKSATSTLILKLELKPEKNYHQLSIETSFSWQKQEMRQDKTNSIIFIFHLLFIISFIFDQSVICYK